MKFIVYFNIKIVPGLLIFILLLLFHSNLYIFFFSDRNKIQNIFILLKNLLAWNNSEKLCFILYLFIYNFLVCYL